MVRYEAPDLPARLPAGVAVLPFGNETVSMRGPELLRKMVSERVSAFGYRSPGLEEVDRLLREIGITDGGQLGAVAPDKVGRTLGVDGLLYGNVEDFVYQNVGFFRRQLVRLRLKLVDAASGERLWEGVGAGEDGQLVVNSKDAGRSFIEGMVEQAAEKAAGTPLRRESQGAVDELFKKFPRRF
ncbi:MAG: GNA1162 family protein [Elusimicrobiota bacterium]